MLNYESDFGVLFLVATPIGNLDDITIRAINTLKEVDIIAAEDTRRSGILLSHYGIHTKMISCHEHNEHQRTSYILDMLKTGKNVALISDAGTPCVSDPGFHLVRSASENQISVVPIPGSCAAIAAMSASGLPTDQFLFLGFLPKKQSHRKKIISKFIDYKSTLVIYESARRVPVLLEDVFDILGDVSACLARELTKVHEEFIRGTLSQILEIVLSREILKGECVVLINGAKNSGAPISDKELDNLICTHLANSDSPSHTSSLAKYLSEQLGISKKQVYDKILLLQETLSD